MVLLPYLMAARDLLQNADTSARIQVVVGLQVTADKRRYYRFFVAITSWTGLRSPVQLILRGACKNAS
jgi:hypothetical protein